MMKTRWIATAIGLGAFCMTAQAQFTLRVAPKPATPSVPGVTSATNMGGFFGPLPCGTKDDGSTENALGLTAGGELGWMKTMNCLTNHDSILTAYGTAMFPGSITNGNTGQLVVYTNTTGSLNPNDPNWVQSVKLNTVVTNGDTDILNKSSYPTKTEPAGSSTMILGSATHAGGVDPTGQEFPGPIDQTGGANPNAWWVGASGTGATLNTTTLTANSTPPLNLTAAGVSGTWMLRAENTGGGGPPGTPLCFGDGSGAACGCGNEAPAGSGSGCLNSCNTGAVLSSTSGSGNIGDTVDILTLQADGIRSLGLFFMAVNTIGGGTGVTFGDGIRCCGGSVLRVSIESVAGTCGTTPTTSTTITTNSPTAGGSGQLMAGITSGDKRCFQYWYRDPGAANPCGAALFNLSNALTVTFGP